MPFELLPAVDVAGGRSVRLVRGDIRSEAEYGAPLDAALAWHAAGAEWIHLVDLDAAFGRGSNGELLAGVVADVDVRVQLSGGIIDDTSLERALATGCERVILSTAALDDPAWCARVIAAHGPRVAVALDVSVTAARDQSPTHRLAPRGDRRMIGDRRDLWETIGQLDAVGCARYCVTDVSRDGTLQGPNIDLYRAVTHATRAQVIASGGISSTADLVTLAELAAIEVNLEGAIVGQALYAGRFTLPSAISAVRGADQSASHTLRT